MRGKNIFLIFFLSLLPLLIPEENFSFRFTKSSAYYLLFIVLEAFVYLIILMKYKNRSPHSEKWLLFTASSITLSATLFGTLALDRFPSILMRHTFVLIVFILQQYRSIAKILILLVPAGTLTLSLIASFPPRNQDILHTFLLFFAGFSLLLLFNNEETADKN